MSSPKVLITGGNSEIGQAVLEKIFQNFSFPVHTTRFSGKSLEVGENITEHSVDLSAPKAIAEFAEKIGGLGITHYIQLQGSTVVNDTIENQSFQSLDFNLNVNLNSTIIIVQALLERMKSHNYGRIVLMNTASSQHGGGFQSFGYGLSKCGIGFTTQYLAKYYSKYNILTNCVSPGYIKTKFHTQTMKRSAKELKEREKLVRVGRAGCPEDVANMIYELAFNNDFISGQNIKIDGADFI